MTAVPPWRRVSPIPRAINVGPLFGPEWSTLLKHGSGSLGVLPAWPLVVMAFESGLDHLRENPQGARGLWQFMGTYHLGPNGEKVRRLYEQRDPVMQLQDAFEFWITQKRVFRVMGFPTRAHFFCLNIAPARLLGGKATMDTILYSKGTRAYEASDKLDREKKGFICLGDLEWPLEKAERIYAQRLRRELEAVAEAT